MKADVSGKKCRKSWCYKPITRTSRLVNLSATHQVICLNIDFLQIFYKWKNTEHSQLDILYFLYIVILSLLFYFFFEKKNGNSKDILNKNKFTAIYRDSVRLYFSTAVLWAKC